MIRRWIVQAWNAMRGYGWDKIGDTYVPRPGTCPRPLCCDWSVRACIRNGACGCNEKYKARP